MIHYVLLKLDSSKGTAQQREALVNALAEHVQSVGAQHGIREATVAIVNTARSAADVDKAILATSPYAISIS